MILIALVYWLFANGYINVDTSLQFVKTAITDVINSITALFKGAAH